MTSKNYGENNGRAKLTTEAVQVIRHLLQQGHTSKEIAMVYGISKALVSAIKTNKVWAKPPEETMDKNKYKGRPFSDEDVKTIVEELTFLLDGGYRANDKAQIMRGLEIALESVTPECWKRWALTPQKNVIQEIYAIGIAEAV